MPRYYSSGYKKSQKSSGRKDGRFWIWSTVVLLILFAGTIYYFTRGDSKLNDNQNDSEKTAVEEMEESEQANTNSAKTNTNRSLNNANKNSSANTNKPKQIKAHIALIIDDLGNQGTEAELSKSLFDLKIPLTLSVIPERPKSKEIALAAKEKGFEIIIHQPMEPVNPALSAEDGAILSSMNDGQITQLIQKHIAEIPQAAGMNNHMGSKATPDAELMRVLMKELKKKKLYFVDSMTISTSKGFAVAKEEGVKTAKRTVFIDGKDDEAYIREQILELANTALEKRVVVPIGIGHIRPKTIAAIREIIPELADMGVGLKKVSEVVE
ncbi:divergent polysaccharide deacetylase family protein [Patescibacteria group bacterium]|nr:MAG: divergent polysaccharide deacetylase family protein [Patescibacteria group bacterium]